MLMQFKQLLLYYKLHVSWLFFLLKISEFMGVGACKEEKAWFFLHFFPVLWASSKELEKRHFSLCLNYGRCFCYVWVPTESFAFFKATNFLSTFLNSRKIADQRFLWLLLNIQSDWAEFAWMPASNNCISKSILQLLKRHVFIFYFSKWTARTKHTPLSVDPFTILEQKWPLIRFSDR